MIKSVEITNFQSHPDTFIEFEKGLNVLTGSSRSGKSTVRRAIMWCITNRPVGNGIVSWWAKKNDKIIKECRVTITLDNGTVISRVKSPELNGYIINGKVLEAVATGVPDEIAEAFNMSDVNYAGQFDAPYLISQSPGYVAQYLNDIVNLEAVDTYQNAVESRRRKCVQTTEATNKEILRLETASKEFSWLERAEHLIAKIKKAEADVMEKNTFVSTVKTIASRHNEASKIQIDLSGIISRASELITQITAKQSERLSKQAELLKIQELYSTYGEASGYTSIPVQSMEKLIKRIEKQQEAATAITQEISALTTVKRTHDAALETYGESSRELKQVQRELDLVDVCPFCHSKLDTVPLTF